MKKLFYLGCALVLLTSCKNVSPEHALKKEIDTGIQKILSNITPPDIPENELDLAVFSGHKPDEEGSHDFYKNIQLAIDLLAKEGGGTLLFSHPEGKTAWIKQTVTYRVKGPIELKSNIELQFDPNTRLYFEFDPKSYLPGGKGVLGRYEGTTLYSFSPLIRAFNAENMAITFAGGNGALPVIDGDGEAWQKWSVTGDKKVREKGEKPTFKQIREINAKDIPIAQRWFDDLQQDFLRPRMMEFFLCKRVLVQNVKLVNSPFWVIHPVFSENMIFRKIMFDAQVVNNDGIDPESSRNILIENIIFDNHDDNVAIKAGRDKEGRDGALVKGTEIEGIPSYYINNGRIGGATENIIVRNCVFKGHYGFCCGSELSGGIKNIYVLDNFAPMAVKMGIFMKSSRKRGGVVENIYINNLQLHEVEADVFSIIPNYDGDTTSHYPTQFKYIYMNNVVSMQSGKGIRIHGWPDMPVENITIMNVAIKDVASEDQDNILLINQVKNVVFKNVNIEDKLYNNTYDKTDSISVPPPQG